MERLIRIVSAAFVGGTGFLLAVAPLDAQNARVSSLSGVQARVTAGSITGTVVDERGGAVSGALVSAFGAILASTVTDESGRFTLNQLVPGDYLLRAHRLGFAASTGTMVRVGVSPAVHRFELRRVTGAVATTGSGEGPVAARPIIEAGFDLPRGAREATDMEPDDPEGHPHDEMAWRLRHIKRSILKDAAPIVAFTGEDGALPAASLFGRAVGSAANLATAFFTDVRFSGELNFLTSSALAPGAVLSATALPRGIAYVALAAPGTGGDWSIRAAMSEGDLSSWIVSGSYLSRPGGSHAYDLGLSYSTQEYTGGNPSALAAVSEGSRNVGELYAFDKWTVNRTVSVEYGARYAHYDYLPDGGLLSPRVGVTVEPFARTRLRARIGQRMIAPGAEEFLSNSTPGPRLPPERTFAPLVGRADGDPFRVERSRSYEVGLERVLADYVIAVGRFEQSVDDQLVTLFGSQRPGDPGAAGHYYVGNAGAVDVDGWALRLDTPASARLQGSIQYSLSHARWSGRGDFAALAAVAPAVIRPAGEDLHDLTSSLRAEIPETATRVFVLYKVNSGYARASGSPERPGLDGRFDVQVNQALPVTFAGTRWEVLIGLRNLFRDPTDPASVYDELLVVRPPKRLVGGFLVRF